MGGSTLKTLGIVAALAVGAIYFNFGTLSPCGALRESVRKESPLARMLPDGVVDAVIEANAGPLTPGHCLGILISGNKPSPQAVAATPAAVQSLSTAAKMASGNEVTVAINECRARRQTGELKTFVASAQCSNPRIVEAYRKANYRYMDLIAEMTAKRTTIAERIDRNEISEVDAGAQLRQVIADLVAAERLRDAMRR